MSTMRERVWLVTGGSSGIGEAIARAALSRGESVAATARDASVLAPLQEEFSDRFAAIALDVTDPTAAVQAVDRAVGAFGRLDVVVNCAGYGSFGSLEEMPLDDLHRLFETNVFGSWQVTRAVLPLLRSQRSGHLVQVSSLDGVAPLGAGESAYAASKFAVEGMCEVLAAEVAHLGIDVTIVEPGPVRSAFGDAAQVAPLELDDYRASVGKALEWFEQLQGSQPNEPAAVAEAVLAAVDSDEPPLRLPVGKEAVEAIRAKLERQLAELDTWEHVAIGGVHA